MTLIFIMHIMMLCDHSFKFKTNGESEIQKKEDREPESRYKYQHFEKIEPKSQKLTKNWRCENLAS